MILVAIGANLPAQNGAAPLATCRAAVEALRGLLGLRLHAMSRWYVTRPVPASDQPDYVNGMVALEGAADPAWLLAALHGIEARAGRARGAANAPRILDLDIIAMNALMRDAPDPILPHPRAHQRAFVLQPLIDVAPGWRHPRLGLRADEILRALPNAGAPVRTV